MAEKPEIGKKEKLKEEAAYGGSEWPPKIKLPPRVDDPPKCGNEPPVIPPIKKARKQKTR